MALIIGAFTGIEAEGPATVEDNAMAHGAPGVWQPPSSVVRRSGKPATRML